MPQVLLQGPLPYFVCFHTFVLSYFLSYLVTVVVHESPLSTYFLANSPAFFVIFITITVSISIVLLTTVIVIQEFKMRDHSRGRDKDATLPDAGTLRAYAAALRADASNWEAQADKLESMRHGNSRAGLKEKDYIERASREAVAGAIVVSSDAKKAKRPDASVVDNYSDFSDDPPIPTPATSKHDRSPSNKSHEPATPGVFNRKIYCSHWLRTGECDFTQQGCEFLHVIPDPETLKRMGYRTYPRWYCEKMNIPVGAAPLVGDSVPKSSSVSPPRVPASLYKKIYCSHWLRTGECDYLQQGCIYQHMIPELKILNEMGFRTYPRWWRDKISMDDGATAPVGGRRLGRLSATANHSQDQGPRSPSAH